MNEDLESPLAEEKIPVSIQSEEKEVLSWKDSIRQVNNNPTNSPKTFT